jgi:hypothetical protein
MRRLVTLGIATLGLSLTVFAATPAQAVNNCPGGTINATTVSGNVVIPGGVTCLITDSTITGTVSVQPNGGLHTIFSTVKGSVTANHPNEFELFGSTTGPVTINGSGNAPANEFAVCGSLISGAFQANSIASVVEELKLGDEDGEICEGGSGRVDVTGAVSFVNNATEIGLEAPEGQFSAYGGSISASGNTGEVGVIRAHFAGGGSFTNNSGSETKLEDNVFKGTLSCSGNNPAPVGSGNTAAAKTGQCAAL